MQASSSSYLLEIGVSVISLLIIIILVLGITIWRYRSKLTKIQTSEYKKSLNVGSGARNIYNNINEDEHEYTAFNYEEVNSNEMYDDLRQIADYTQILFQNESASERLHMQMKPINAQKP